MCCKIMVSLCRSDLAYFDGLSETILSAGLVKPKAGTERTCLATSIEVTGKHHDTLLYLNVVV